jgi:uncharacterized protein YecE (DUF72 family)
VLKAWTGEVPEGFKFVLKASQKITHFSRLKNVADPVAYLVKVSAALGNHLGPLLFQLPPNLKKDLPRLKEFLALLPSSVRAALEFRNESWFDDEVFGLMREHRAALCIAEAEEGVEVPFVATADWGYLRLRMPEYTTADLNGWLNRVRDTEWGEAFVFFKHEDEGKGPKLARQFIELAARA